MSGKKKLVVVGNGMAGARTVEEILRRGGAQLFDITIFGDEPYGNYNRIMLSNVLSGVMMPADIFLNPLSWYEENNIHLHSSVRVTEIDRDAKTVTGDSGIVVPYDVLLIATGSRPFMPPVEGLNGPGSEIKRGVFTFRTIDDCHKIAGCANKCGKALVIGGGLLGLEAARGLLKFGVEVHVAHIGAHLMNNQLDAASGAMLKKTLIPMGIQTHLSKRTVKFLGGESLTGVMFDDGTTLECDMAVISAGITPNVEIARECGLTVNRAIVVDDQMRSIDDGNIFAVGECAEHRGKVYGLVAPLWEQGLVLAEHLTGQKPSAAYHGSKVATKLKAAGVALATMGVTEPEFDTDEVALYSESRRGIYQKLILRDDVLIGGILLGDTDKAASLIQAFDRGTPLPENRRIALFDSVEAPPEKPESKLLVMPDDAKVCNCMSLTKGQIRKCVEAGNTTLPMVQAACKAGMGCGSCKPLVQDVITWVTGEAVAPEPSASIVDSTPKALAGIPLGNPEVADALKILIREVVNWACKD